MDVFFPFFLSVFFFNASVEPRLLGIKHVILYRNGRLEGNNGRIRVTVDLISLGKTATQAAANCCKGLKFFEMKKQNQTAKRAGRT